MIINFSNLGGGGGGSEIQVIDNLQSTSSTAALSAKQGKVLNEAKADTTAVTESIHNALTAYTETTGFTTINGSAITEGGNIQVTADSTKIEKITTLPENPVDGAVYNYNGVLIKYINGAGNWGYWDGISVTKSYDRAMKNSATLFYGVIPASMEGELVFGLGHIDNNTANTKLWAYINLSGDTIDIYNNSGKTGSTLYSIQRNAGSQTKVNNSSIVAYISWDDGVIQINFDSHYDQLLKYCDTSILTAHYELEQTIQRKYTISRDLEEPNYVNMPPYYLAQFDTKTGVAHPGIKLTRGNVYINNSGYSNGLTYWGNSAPIQHMFVPTVSGATGALLVSQGNAEPQWKTTEQALGVSFWTGTQDEYDAITTKSANTLYIIIPDNS